MAREAAGLAGILVVGPKEIPRGGGLEEAAVRRVRSVKEFFGRYEEGGEADPGAAEIAHLADEERGDLDSAALLVPGGEPEALVAEFLDFWEKGSPDCVSRVSPDDPEQIIVFAAYGESLFGESAGGYELLEGARAAGLFEVFGIR